MEGTPTLKMTFEKKGIDYMYDLYLATSKKKFTKVVVCPELYPYAKLIYEAYDNPISLIDNSGKLLFSRKKRKKPFFVFLVSSGKDSLATFFKHRKKQKKQNKLVHVLNINPLYPFEKKLAKRIFKLLRLNVDFFNFKLRKTGLWLPESVIKNQMIYAFVLEKLDFLPLAIGFGGTRYVGPQSMAFFHDNFLAFKLFHEFANKAWGTHKLLPFLDDEIMAYQILFKKAPTSVLNILGSCMADYKEKGKIKRSVETKFNFSISNKYECGKCYKCAEKAIIEDKFLNKKYPKKYLSFCKKIISDKIKETLKLNGYPASCLKQRFPKHYLERMGFRN